MSPSFLSLLMKQFTRDRVVSNRSRFYFLFCGVEGSLCIAPAMEAALRDRFWNKEETARTQ
jgi:hypothetical protein